MTTLHDMLADLPERNPKRLIDEDTFRQQFARRGYKIMLRHKPGHVDGRYWLMFAEPRSLQQIDAFLQRLDMVQP